MKLLELRENIFCLKGFVNIGVIVNRRGEALLVDAGLDERVARRVQESLDEKKVKVKGVIITHAHADHYGGASYFATSGSRIYASAVEKAVIDNPLLEASGLFGGAFPPAELRRKYFNAPRVALHATVSPGMSEVEGLPLEIVDLGGHTLGQIGVAVEKVLFCADSLATPGQMQKQGLLKNADIERTMKTFTRLEARQDVVFVTSHGEVLSDIKPLTALNRQWVEQTLDLVLGMTGRPVGVEDLLAAICDYKGVVIKTLSQYHILHLSLLAYLTCLLDRSLISAVYHGNRQRFQKRSAEVSAESTRES